uniref:Myosin XVI n=1 Tax=Neogobius melanostomus TaxID=47308 RepID=A0A8C6WNU7_9GOBI
MEIDQCLLESLPIGQRQRLVRRMRCDQIKAYYEREKSLQRQQGANKARVPPNHKKKHRVRFGLNDILQDAIIRHDDKEVLRLLKDGADINSTTASGGSLLHLCARHDNVFAAELLIERGLNVNLQDEDQWSALHVACVCDHSDVLLLLLLAGVNVLLQDVSGNIPLDYTSEGTETNYILRKYLEENGVDMPSMHTMKTQRAVTMLSDVRQLFATGEASAIIVHIKHVFVLLQLHIACASGYREVVAVLLERGADPHPADNHGWTPLHLAAKYGQVMHVNLFFKVHIAASEPIAEMLLNAEETWLQRLEDPSLPLPSTDQHSDSGLQDLNTPVKNLNPFGVSISKRDSFLEKCAMFREAGGGLARQPSQDNGLDSPFSSGTSKLEQVKLMPPAPNDDLASLSELTDSSLLYEMQKRFGNDQIYTYIGHILLLVNPNKELPIYSTLVSQLYLSSTGRLCSSLPPHIFSSAERAYHMMLQERRPQCFILSGESGSGKTEVCKHIVRHLCARSSSTGFSVDSRMKHVSLKTQTRVHTYMLEKSRLVHLPPNQHNFAIFHLMAEGLSAEEKSALYLNNVLAHRYMTVATASTQSKERLFAVKQALRAMGFNKQEVESVFSLLSAVLHIGDLDFSALTEADTALPSDRPQLDRVAGMLQVCSNDLSTALTSDVQYFKGDVITRRHTVEMSEQYRDQLAKAIYGRLFSYLVNSINEYLQGQDDGVKLGTLFLGNVLIWRMFCAFQLFVNMTNERLREYVSQVLFQQEHTECQQEGIATETPRCPGNQPVVLDFFLQKPQGLLCMLDEESQSLRPAEQTLYKRLSAQLDSSPTHGLFLTTKDGNGNPPPKDQGPAFTVKHYAGQVAVSNTVFQILIVLFQMLKKKGSSSFLQRLERCGPVTVAVQLRNSLSELISKLQSCSPHFVECVRPNASGQPDTFDSAHVSSQLQYIGVLEMVRMIRYGYPVRMSFLGFLSKYRDLVIPTLGDKKKLSAEERCRSVLQQCKLQGWQMGSSKVFLRYWLADQLNDRCYHLQKKIITCQKVVRGWLARRRFLQRLLLLQTEECAVQQFLKEAEDMGLRTYDQLVIQNAADISRESDRLRCYGNAPEGSANGGARVIRHFRSSSVPIPLAMETHKPSLQQVVHNSEEGAGGAGLSSPRKQPPPKPKRDPNTRLSASYEAVSAGLTMAAKETKPRPHSDDYTTMRKVPPPKPKRSPNTKLSGSYEEINAVAPQLQQLRPADVKLALLSRAGGFGGLMHKAASIDAPHGVSLSLFHCQDEEDVYIEMFGSHPRSRSLQEPPDSPDLNDSEAVYEEMKYDGLGTVEPAAPPQTSTNNGLTMSQHVKDGCDIPAPFPNLLPHRPPLLVFPPSPVTCSPASDESPLTPLEVKKLPVFETNLNYATGPDSPLSPQYSRQRADSSPSLTVLMSEKKPTPPLTPPPAPPPPAIPPPPYRPPPSHFPFPPDASFLSLTRASSLSSDSPKTVVSQRTGVEPQGKPPPYSPVKASRPEPRRAHSCSSSPLLFNPANGRPLTSPLDELNTLFSSGRNLLKKPTPGRKMRDGGLSQFSKLERPPTQTKWATQH